MNLEPIAIIRLDVVLNGGRLVNNLSTSSHKVYKKFKDAGIEDRAADAFVEAINEARATDLENLATKQDLANVSVALKQEIADIKSELKQEIADVKSELKQEITDVKSELKQEVAELKSDIRVINVRIGSLEKSMNDGFAKIYNMGKFILALILIPIGIKVIELFLPKLFQ